MITVVVVEDELLWREKILAQLDEIGVQVIAVACNVQEASLALQIHQPQVLIADIMLQNDVVFSIFEQNTNLYNLPTILLSNSTKEIHYKQAQKINKCIYLVKPVHKLTLKSIIENCINSTKNKKDDFIEIKGNRNEKIKLPLSQIVYIKQEGNYCYINSTSKQFVLYKSLSNMLYILNHNFLQIHRSCCVNINYIESFNKNLDFVKLKDDTELIIGRVNKQKVKDFLAVINVDGDL